MANRQSDNTQWARLKARCPDILARIESAGSVRLALTELEAGHLESYAATRKDVQAALARRERALRDRLLAGDRTAELLLRADFDLRPAPARTPAEEFQDVVQGFFEWCEAHQESRARECYAAFYRLLQRKGKSAAERRMAHAEAV